MSNEIKPIRVNTVLDTDARDYADWCEAFDMDINEESLDMYYEMNNIRNVKPWVNKKDVLSQALIVAKRNSGKVGE